MKVFVSSEEELRNIEKPYGKHIEYICHECGQIGERGYNCHLHFPLLCKKCIKKHATEKQKKNLIEKYGVENVSQLDSVKKKIREKWTDERREKAAKWISSEDFKKKNVQTCLDKYGLTNGGGCKEAIDKIRESLKTREKKTVYRYDGFSFDSYWELAYYIYCKEQGLNITRKVEPLIYRFDGEEHFYIPDFVVNGEYVEIKGNHFFKDGKMINPFDRNLDKCMEAKYQCMLKNNVKILFEEDLKDAFDYTWKKYKTLKENGEEDDLLNIPEEVVSTLVYRYVS